MSHKADKNAAFLTPFLGKSLPAHYLAFFDCFNRHLYYEAHDVLEELWLKDRKGPDGNFYKGLIQLAGAFVHLQKNRPQPAAALFRLSQANLTQYPAIHHSLAVQDVAAQINVWLNELGSRSPTTSWRSLHRTIQPATS